MKSFQEKEDREEGSVPKRTWRTEEKKQMDKGNQIKKDSSHKVRFVK